MSGTNESAPSIRHSRVFPPGYGDFTILSCENVLFSFPRGILAHVSPVFRDMFALDAQGDEAHFDQASEPLQLQEDGTTISLMLQHIDPAKEAPEMLKSTVVNLVKAAHKYQIMIIITRFQKTVVLEPASPLGEDSAVDLIFVNPLQVLSLALYTGLDRLAQFALTQVMASRVTVLAILDTEMDPLLKKSIIVLRRQWEDWYIRDIDILRKSFKEAGVSCSECHSQFNDWCFAVVKKARETPTWTSVASTRGMLQSKCKGCDRAKPLQRFMTEADWKGWSSRALEREKPLPKIP